MSGWARSIPVSTTPIATPGAPVETAHADLPAMSSPGVPVKPPTL
jgi:hypothetical protein